VDGDGNISLIDLKKIRTELEEKRKQMIEVGMQSGLSSPKTLRLSQEIDTLHNKLNYIVCK
jgi:hypothetical protein